MQDPDPSFRPVIGQPEWIAPGLRRIVAPNPSPMTFRGTNTYILGTAGLAVIDPGPEDAAHLQAILAACTGGQTITHILVTHAHLDHSPLARALSQATGASVLAFGDATAGQSAVMRHLAQGGAMGGGEGVDAGFVPDHCLDDGAVIQGDGWMLRALHTPGHFGNHLALAWNDTLFCGDLVMGWATSLVSPPDGDLTDFMASCRRLASGAWSAFYPGHGDIIADPHARLDWLITHRMTREAAILTALSEGPATAQTLAERVYTDTPKALMPAAARNVLSHLIDLYGKSRVESKGTLTATSTFSRIDTLQG